MVEFLPLLWYVALSGGLALLLLGLSFLLATQRGDVEKTSPYECGFDPFEDARGRFDIRFYLVAILFLVFDLEVTFLFPWALSLAQVGGFGFGVMTLFLGVLTLGFLYEWRKGALEWE
uniref:NADH-ubiquinone oxidoreductase chain 3 n=1 Tax=Picocystis salinarum TaxID=88271 RepID=A0A4D6C453_9CHLO|nr:NADH dehydrogenase subunit 3 [Picocystis salinarum]QBX98526.1 NADH dehydrogenase subunit 3 [Picocystis salinarum]